MRKRQYDIQSTMTTFTARKRAVTDAAAALVDLLDYCEVCLRVRVSVERTRRPTLLRELRQQLWWPDYIYASFSICLSRLGIQSNSFLRCYLLYARLSVFYQSSNFMIGLLVFFFSLSVASLNVIISRQYPDLQCFTAASACIIVQSCNFSPPLMAFKLTLLP